MTQRQSQTEMQDEMVSRVRAMHVELYEWRQKHPEATMDEIAAQMTPRRRQLIGKWLAQLACQEGNGTVVEGLVCPSCGETMVYKGDSPRKLEHLEGEIPLGRAYYFCPSCKQKIFPPGSPSTNRLT
jgi:predicted RNA-binding Zn-ribbon protein involved in translation (DUF1610 family)